MNALTIFNFINYWLMGRACAFGHGGRGRLKSTNTTATGTDITVHIDMLRHVRCVSNYQLWGHGRMQTARRRQSNSNILSIALENGTREEHEIMNTPKYNCTSSIGLAVLVMSLLGDWNAMLSCKIKE
jgi:hypothetical protein